MKYGNQLNYGIMALAVVAAVFTISKTLLNPLDTEAVLTSVEVVPAAEESPESSLSLTPRPVPAPAEPARPATTSLPSFFGNANTTSAPAAAATAPVIGSGGATRRVQSTRPDRQPARPLNLSGAERRRSSPNQTRRASPAATGRPGRDRNIARPAGAQRTGRRGGALPDRSGARTQPAPPPTRSSNQ